MPYLGNIPAENYASFDKQTITGDGGTSYTLTHPVANAQEVALFVNNVRQEPGVAYTVNGTALTMTGNVESTDDFYAVFIGKAVQSVRHPTDEPLTATVGTFTDGLTVDDDGAAPLTVDRASSEGTVVDLQKDGTTFGTLGIDGSDLVIDGPSGHTGLRMTTGGLLPRQNGAIIDNTIELGSTGYRFKDLYLGGNLYIGGTGSANGLNDYEEGSFTPNITFNNGSSGMTFSSREGRYTKIGNMCTVYVEMNLSNKGSAAGSVKYGGLPFNAAGDIQDRAIALQMFRGVPSGSDNLAHLFHVFPENNSSHCILRSTISTGDAGPDNTDYDNDTRVSFTLTYKTP